MYMGLQYIGLVNGLPDDVHRFIHQHVASVELLEVLLLARRSPGRKWSVEDVSRELYSHPTSIARRFEALLGSGFVRETAPGVVQYAPRTMELDAAISRLAELYRERPVAVITAIASSSIENVRAFSDAFRIRRKED
jgi:AraC-like DNA-binding protein